jgi:hypothetical protein
VKRHLREIEERLRHLLIEPLQKSAGNSPEPLDLWTEIQKSVRAHITVNISGVRIFPSRHVHVQVNLADGDHMDRLRSALNPTLLRAAISELLVEEDCRAPEGFWASIDYLPNPAAGGAIVLFDNLEAAEPTAIGAAVLRVRSGQANPPELQLPARRINVGRRARLRDDQGNTSRHNDLAFADISNGVNETVSRQHAHVEFDEARGTYRLLRDSPSAETCVVRQGVTLSNVPLSGPGLILRSGDVIRLGKAEIEFQMGVNQA